MFSNICAYSFQLEKDQQFFLLSAKGPLKFYYLSKVGIRIEKRF